MTKQQFTEKYGLRGFDSVEDVLMTIASNLSDLQHSSRNLNGKINNIKEFIFAVYTYNYSFSLNVCILNLYYI